MLCAKIESAHALLKKPASICRGTEGKFANESLTKAFSGFVVSQFCLV